MGRVISPNQHAFIYGRQIFNASLIANERLISTSSRTNQVPFASLILGRLMTMFLRVFLGYTRKSGFPSTWRSWTLFGISTVRYSELVNGEASGFFISSRGLPQGDPLYPLLFILVMETLSRLGTKLLTQAF